MTIKIIHIVCAILSFTGFFLRGIWMLRESPQLQKRWVKIAPHIVDTVLLITAIPLAIELSQFPFTHDWLTAKVVALVIYIVVGSIGLKRGKTKQQRTIAWIAALLVFGYIFAVALTRSPTILLF